MALDHYVSQVHLRNFYAPALGNRMYAIRKSDLTAHPCRAQDVCRTKEGSTNDYLVEPRAVEEFLTTIEPKYNESVDTLRSGTISADSVYVIAGFVAYVLTCSPAAMRINSGPLRGALEATAALLDKRGDIPPAPPELEGKTLSELLANGTVALNIDGKYPQAIGIGNITIHTNNLGNSEWEILLNDVGQSPFFTSDYPVAIEPSANVFVINRIVPLAPDIAVRIKPNPARPRSDDFKFPGFSYTRRRLAADDVRSINRAIVRCAEDSVFFRGNLNWIPRFVERNRYYRVETAVRSIPKDRGELVWSRLELQERRP